MKNLLLNVFAITASAVFAMDNNKVGTDRNATDSDGAAKAKKVAGPVIGPDGKEVIYVSPEGKRLSPKEASARVKDGSPTSVHFDSDGEVRVVRRPGQDNE